MCLPKDCVCMYLNRSLRLVKIISNRRYSLRTILEDHFTFPQLVLVVKNLPANSGDITDTGSIPGLGRFPGGGHGNPTPVFLPGESHGE